MGKSLTLRISAGRLSMDGPPLVTGDILPPSDGRAMLLLDCIPICRGEADTPDIAVEAM